MTDAKSPGAAASVLPWSAAAEYGLDAWQRSVLFLDVLRQRGNQYLEHMAMQAPNVLQFQAELVVDGRALPRPVNYVLARIIPPTGVTVDQRKRPFVVVDPRSGHGPGIGCFKARRSSLLLRGLPPRAGARADDRGHHGGRGRLPRARDPAPPRR